MANLGVSPFLLIIWMLAYALPVLSWVMLYVRGAATRDLIFWGVISVVIPFLGPLAAIIFALRFKSKNLKREPSDTT